MLLFAHIGIGKWCVERWKKFPTLPLVIGTLLPDLIDKPLYYGLVLVTGKKGAELFLITGTRTIGHSLLFLLCLLVIAKLWRKEFLWAMAAGAITHLVLDNISELRHGDLETYSSRIALFFPFYGWRFPVAPHPSLMSHLEFHANWLDFATECLGIALLTLPWLIQRIKSSKISGKRSTGKE